MTTARAGFQSRFGASLFDAPADADAEAAWVRQPAFAVYRNTVMSACIDALQANFPSVARLVGADWFRAAAGAYVRAQPPRDGRLLMYGETFADFLAAFEAARELPYLPGVARLDRFWIEAHTAADADPADRAWIAGMTPAALGALRLSPHPAARWCFFEGLPIGSIWTSNRLGVATTDEFVWQGEGIVLARPGDAVVWQPVGRCGVAFLQACAHGHGLAEAAAAALEAAPDADIAALLARLLTLGALIGSTSNVEENAS